MRCCESGDPPVWGLPMSCCLSPEHLGSCQLLARAVEYHYIKTLTYVEVYLVVLFIN